MKNLPQQLKELIKSQDWEGLARTFHEADIKWHAEEWKNFIEAIATSALEEERARIVEALEGMKKEHGDMCELNLFEVGLLGKHCDCSSGINNRTIKNVLSTLKQMKELPAQNQSKPVSEGEDSFFHNNSLEDGVPASSQSKGECK